MDYRQMSFEQIHDDLLETVNDLYYNACQQPLERLLLDFDQIDETKQIAPSERLVDLMQELLTYDTNQLDPHAQSLMRAAVDEMLKLAGPASDSMK